MPIPNAEETRKMFIARCMSNFVMKEDFPDRKQRAAVCFKQWRDNMSEEFKERMLRYPVTENEDGTKNIVGVPIFKLGEFKSKSGKPYDEKWFKRAVARHSQLKSEEEYLPTFHPGHNKDDGTELPSFGLFDNLRKKGQMVLADLIKIGKDAWAQIMDGKWPYRSVEAINTAGEARLLSLALLGSRPPAVKTPPLFASEYDHFEGAPEEVDSFMIEECFSMTYDDLHRALSEAVAKKFPSDANEVRAWVKVVFIDEPKLIVEHDGKLWAMTWSKNDQDEIVLGEPTAVKEAFVPVMAQEDVTDVDNASEDIDENNDNDESNDKEINMAEEKDIVDKKDEEVTDAAPADETPAEEETKEVEEVKDEKKEEPVEQKTEETKKVDSLSAELTKNENAELKAQVAQMAEQMAEWKAEADQKAEEARASKIDAFIVAQNKDGKLPRSIIGFDGEENSTALKDFMMELEDEKLDSFKLILEKMGDVGHFQEIAEAGDETQKTAAGTIKVGQNVDGQKVAVDVSSEMLAERVDAYVKENEGIDYVDAYKIVRSQMEEEGTLQRPTITDEMSI
jgi:hypothetical protein